MICWRWRSSASTSTRERFGAALARTEDAIERVRRTWDAGYRCAITRLDQLREQAEEAARLAWTLVAGGR